MSAPTIRYARRLGLAVGGSVAAALESQGVIKIRTLALAAALALTGTARAQTTVYWDTNTTTAGSSGGTTAPGTWDAATTANWSTSSVGTSTTSTWNSVAGGTKIAVFSAGTNATGASAITLSGAVTNLAGFTFEEGATTISGGTSLTFGTSSTLNVSGSASAAISSVLAGSSNLIKAGSGSLTLSGTNTFTGSLTLNAGILRASTNTQALGTGAATLVLNGGTLELSDNAGAGVNYGRNTTVTGNTTIYSDRNSAGAGTTQTLGTLSIAGQTLSVTAGGNATSATAGVTFGVTTLTGGGGSTLSVTNTASAATLLTLGALTNGSANNSATTLTKSGNGTLTLANAASNLNNGTAINVTGGTLNSNQATALGALANVTLSSGATLSIGADQTLAALNGSAGTVALGTYNITVGAANNLTSTYGGIITGSGILTKAGTGTLTLSGDSTFSGATNITVGMLKLGATGGGTNTPLGTTAAGTNVVGNAALDLGGFTLGTAEGLTLNGVGVRNTGALTNSGGAATWSGTVALASASTIAGTGNIAIAGATSGNFALTKEGTNTLTFRAANSSTSTVFINQGGLTLSGSGTMTAVTGYTLNPGGTFTLDNSAGYSSRISTNAITVNGGTFTYTPVATSSNTQSAGSFTLNGGATLNTTATGSTFTSTLAFTNFSRTTGGTLTVSSDSFFGSDTRNYVRFTGTAPAAVSGALPWGVVTQDGGSTYNFLNYAGGGGGRFQVLTTYQTGAESNWTGTGVEARPAADATLTANRTLNILALDSGIDVALAGFILNAGNGASNPTAFLKTGATGSTISGTGSLALAAHEGIFHVFGAGGLSISSTVTGTAGITKSGSGALTFSGTNAALSGTITLNEGTLRTQTATALGNAVIGAPLVLNGGTLQLANNSGTSFNYNTTVRGDATVQSDVTTASNPGVTHTLGTLTLGATNNTVVNLTIDKGSNVSGGTPAITFGATTLIGNGATVTTNTGATLNLGAISGTGFNFTVAGAGNTNLTGIIGTSTGGSLLKTDSGTLTLSNVVSTYTGGTTLSGGVTNFTALNNLGTGGITMDGGTLQWASGSTVDISARTITLNSTGGTFDTNGNNVTLSTAGIGNTGSGGFTKTGTGTLTLSGAASTFTGNIAVQQGTYVAGHSTALGLGTGTHTVLTGAALGLSGTSTVSNNSATVSIAGDGISNSGALYNVSGTNNTLNANISLSAAARIGSAGNTLTLGQTIPSFTAQGHTQPNDNSFITLGDASLGYGLTFSGAGNITVNSRIRDYAGQTPGMSFSDANTIAYKPTAPTTPGNVTIDMASGAASVTYQANANSYTGTTFVKNGTLILNTYPNTVAPHDTATDSFHAINGPLVIGNGSTSAKVQIYSGFYPNEPIAINTPVTLYSDGTLALNGASTTIDTLTFITGGTVLTNNFADGTGTLFLNNNVFFNSTVNGQTASIGASANDGTLSLELNKAAVTDPDNGVGATRTFTITPVDGSSTATLTVNSTVVRGDVVKAGNGLLIFAGNNSYLGTTTVNDGIFRATRGDDGSFQSAFGSADGTDARGTTVADGATVQLSGGITVSREKLNLNGEGHNGGGALQNFSGDNTWGNLGNINLVTNSRINSDAGTLTITSNLTSTGNDKALTVGGVGNTTISGQISTGTGSTTTLTKDGTGILTLSGSNGYQGLTDIQAGIVVAAHDNALGSPLAGTQVTANAELRLTNTITIPGEALTLNGTGYAGGGTGALRNFSGSNTYQGAITIGSAATRINSDTGTMTLTGGISTGGNAFVVGGAGNTAETGAVGGLGALTKDGAGTASFSNVTGLGNITINAGTLTFSGSSTTGSTVTSNTGTTNFNGASATVGQVHLLNTSTINVSSSTTLNTAEFASASLSTLDIASGGTVVATYATGNTTFSGNITGSGTFKAFGAGQVTFNENITNTGLTLYLGGGASYGNSVGTMASPLTFTITDTTALSFGTIRITGDTILDFGNSAASSLTSANLLIDSGVLVTVQNWISLTDFWKVTTSFSQTSGPASVPDVLGTQPQNQITFTGFSNNATSWITIGSYPSYFDKEIRPVPEPSTYGAMFISGCLAFLGYRRYRARAKK